MHIDELNKIAGRLEQAESPINGLAAKQGLGALEQAIRKVESAWSGSWLGYHARVYYEELQVPPAEAKFSNDWGLLTGDGVEGKGSEGAWCKYRRQDVIDAIWQNAGKPDLTAIRRASNAASAVFGESMAKLQPLMTSILARKGKEDVLTGLARKISGMSIYREENFIRDWSPNILPASKDTTAIGEGLQVPPHVTVKAEIWVIRHPFMLCGELAKTTRWLASHLATLAKQAEDAKRAATEKSAARNKDAATSVCICHGRSGEWKELRAYIENGLHLPSGEFNRVPVAGLANFARLAELLRQSAFAVLVLTGDDEDAEGAPVAGMNVVHEAGLFQGRLGFGRAVILVEEGCGDLSQVHGLPRIRFPKGHIASAFGELRALLEQEKIIAG